LIEGCGPNSWFVLPRVRQSILSSHACTFLVVLNSFGIEVRPILKASRRGVIDTDELGRLTDYLRWLAEL
jgi:hypothetical protein